MPRRIYLEKLASLLICFALHAGVMAQPSDPSRLISYDSVWKYDQSGADLGTAWRQPNYNDGSWPSGPGVLGFPQNEALPAVGAAIQTILATNNGDTRIRTYYFRTHFTYTNSQTSGISLTASNLLDDGAVYYLNGVEVGRIAMPFGTTNDYQTGSTRADDISNHGVDVLILTPTNL